MDAENEAAEVRLRAERRAGELLRDSDKNRGTQMNGGDTGGPIVGPPVYAPKLADLGVTKSASSR